MDDSFPSDESLLAVPLFPLPNVVLFPRAVLPLHIFEERYKAMTADVLKGDHQIAMALLQSGWEKSYYGKPAIEPVVCVGTIVSHEQLPDGKYTFLLQGQVRARIVFELPTDRAYRMARLKLLPERPVLEIDLSQQRERLFELFSSDIYASTSLGAQFRRLLSSPWPTADIVDLIAFNYFEDPQLKQSLLADEDIVHRVIRAIWELEHLRPRVQPAARLYSPPSLN